MGDLRKKLDFLQGKPSAPGELWAVRINSGMFGVTWERTKRVLEQCGLDLQVAIPPEEAEKKSETRARARRSNAPAPVKKSNAPTLEANSEAQKEDTPTLQENGLDTNASENMETQAEKRKHMIEPTVPSDSANQDNKSGDDLVAEKKKKKKKKRKIQAETAHPSGDSIHETESTQDLARKERKEKQKKKKAQKHNGSTAV